VTTLVIAGGVEPESCQAHVDVVADWGTGWLGEVTIDAGDEPVDGWDLTWTWPGSQRIRHLWNAEWTQTDATVTAADVGWNARIAAKESRDVFGFTATGPAVPLDFSR
jgi:cellulase/cellobiase CelA1